jgi:hypothetical protein
LSASYFLPTRRVAAEGVFLLARRAAAEGVWHLLGSRQAADEGRTADRDSRQCQIPISLTIGVWHCLDSR